MKSFTEKDLNELLDELMPLIMRAKMVSTLKMLFCLKSLKKVGSLSFSYDVRKSSIK